MRDAKVEHRLRLPQRLRRDDAVNDQAKAGLCLPAGGSGDGVDDGLRRAGRSAQRLIPWSGSTVSRLMTSR